MATEGHAAPSAGEYVVHHLHHLQNKPQHAVADFSVVNFDSIFFAVVIGVIGSFIFWRVAKSVTSGVPGRFQAAIEILVEMVDDVAGHVLLRAREVVEALRDEVREALAGGMRLGRGPCHGR